MSQKSAINSYRDLLVWQKGMALAKQVYRMTEEFPDHEKFSLMAQMRRAAVSVPSNIAEDQARQGGKEFVQFLSHAEGSLAELDTRLTLAADLRYCFTVVGVMPPEFQWQFWSGPRQLWVPVGYTKTDYGRDENSFIVIARLKPGATAEQARADSTGSRRFPPCFFSAHLLCWRSHWPPWASLAW